VGSIKQGIDISPQNARPGDAILVSGTIGDHGIAIMSVREGLKFETQIQSDSAPLPGLVEAMLEAAPEIHCLRDATRGGLAGVLCEIAKSSKAGIEFEESLVPIKPAVKSACEMLGLDPYYVANEGKLVAVVPDKYAEEVMMAMRNNEFGEGAEIIGRVTQEHPGMVTVRTVIGGRRVVDLPAGELLPRIC
jgi:hydrogenase expression/formation protein HypE